MINQIKHNRMGRSLLGRKDLYIMAYIKKETSMYDGSFARTSRLLTSISTPPVTTDFHLTLMKCEINTSFKNKKTVSIVSSSHIIDCIFNNKTLPDGRVVRDTFSEQFKTFMNVIKLVDNAFKTTPTILTSTTQLYKMLGTESHNDGTIYGKYLTKIFNFSEHDKPKIKNL